MKTGDTVAVRQPPPIIGAVAQRRVTPQDDIECLVQWNEGGHTVERWFAAGDLEPVAAEGAHP